MTSSDPPAEAWTVTLVTERRHWWSGEVTDRRAETLGIFASEALAEIAASKFRGDESRNCRVTVVRNR